MEQEKGILVLSPKKPFSCFHLLIFKCETKESVYEFCCLNFAMVFILSEMLQSQLYFSLHIFFPMSLAQKPTLLLKHYILFIVEKGNLKTEQKTSLNQ